jgi:hypothetical protein
MGILDTLKSIFGSGPAGVPEQQMRGPLRLAPGDSVSYYKDRYAVTGLRVLEGDGSTIYQYILRDSKGGRIVLAAESGPDPQLTLQKVVTGQVDWNADVLEGLLDEPLKLTHRGTMRVKSYGDPLTMASRTLNYREYEDASGEQLASLEDFGNYKEVRVGEPVFEPECVFHRAGEDAPPAEAEQEAEVVVAKGDAERRRGSPIAAAMALSGKNASDVAPLRADASKVKGREDQAGDDIDPTAYDDEKWSDEEEEAAKPASATPGVEDFVDSEEDEWLVATQFVREQGDKNRDKS